MAFSGKQVLIFAVLGVVGLLILGALGGGAGSYLYELANQNTSRCATGNCTASDVPNTMVILMAGTIVPIIWFVAVALKLL